MLQFYSWRSQQKKKKKRAGECGGGKDIAELEAEYVEGGAGRGGAGRGLNPQPPPPFPRANVK